MQTEQMGAANSVAALSRSEHLLVWALRTFAVGQSDCPVLERTFRGACGEAGVRTLQAYFVLVRYIALKARRRLRVHAPGCPCLSADEAAVVGVVAAAQAGDGTWDGLLDMRLAYLVRSGGREPLAFAAQAVGDALRQGGHQLPVRLDLGLEPASGTEPDLRVIH